MICHCEVLTQIVFCRNLDVDYMHRFECMFITRSARAVLLSVESVCESVCQRDSSWTVRDIITKFPEHHPRVQREAGFENGYSRARVMRKRFFMFCSYFSAPETPNLSDEFITCYIYWRCTAYVYSTQVSVVDLRADEHYCMPCEAMSMKMSTWNVNLGLYSAF